MNAKQTVGYTIVGLLWLWLMVLTFRFLSLNYQGPFIVLKQILLLKNALLGATMQQCQSVTRLPPPASVTAMILLSIANTFKGARNKWLGLNSLCLQSCLPHSVIFITLSWFYGFKSQMCHFFFFSISLEKDIAEEPAESSKISIVDISAPLKWCEITAYNYLRCRHSQMSLGTLCAIGVATTGVDINRCHHLECLL